MLRTRNTAIAVGRVIVDGVSHFAIGSIVAFCGLTLALPLLTEALLAVGVPLPV